MDSFGRSREIQVAAVVTDLLVNLGIDEEPETTLSLLSRGALSTPVKGGYPLAETIALKAAHLAHSAPGRFRLLYEKLSKHVSLPELAPLHQIIHAVQKETGLSSVLKTPAVKNTIQKSMSDNSNVSATPLTRKLINRSLNTTRISATFTQLDGSTLASTRTPIPSAGYATSRSQSDFLLSDDTFNSMVKRPMFQSHQHVSVATTPALPTNPVEQEKLLIDDALHVLLGVDSTCIRKNATENDTINFTCNSQLDNSLIHVAEYVASIARDYVSVQNFIDSRSGFKFGKVQHALSAAIRVIIQDYLVLIGQLESSFRQLEQFGAQKLMYSLRQSQGIMKSIARLIERIEVEIPSDTFLEGAFNGTKILGILHDMMVTSQGSPDLHKVYEHILSKSSDAYLTMLRTWIWDGELQDPFREFFIQEKEGPDDVDQGYIFCENAPIPSFLQPLSGKIFESGKYVCVLKKCSAKELSLMKTLSDSGHRSSLSIEEVFRMDVEKAFKASNEAILHLLMRKSGLLDRIKLIKKTVLLTQSDYLMQFVDIALDELSKPRKKISLNKVQSLFELALKGSSVSQTAGSFLDLLRVELKTTTLFQQLDRINNMTGLQMSKSGGGLSILSLEEKDELCGIESFAITWHDSLPMSLIFTQTARSKYEILFRLAFTIKMAEALLLRTGKPSTKLPISLQTSLIRSKMLHFFQSVLYYMFVEVFEPRYAKLESDFNTVDTLSDLVHVHENFLDSCMKECLLSNLKLMSMIEGLLSSAFGFVSHVLELADSGDTEADTGESLALLQYLGKYRSKTSHLTNLSGESSYLQWFDKDFSNRAHQFLGSMRLLSLTETPRLAHLALQLDFNGYLSLQ